MSAEKMKNPLNCRGDPERIIFEARSARFNCRLILKVARDIAKNSFLAKYSRTFRIDGLEDLVKYLDPILADIIEDPKNDAGKVMPDLEKITFTTLCPLTMFLRIVAKSLSDLRVKTRSGTWEGIGPLHTQLTRLQADLRVLKPDADAQGDNTLAGVARCIMFHEEHQVFTVASAGPAYVALSGLAWNGKWIRNRHLSQLKKNMNSTLEQDIQRRLRVSEDALRMYNAGSADWEEDYRRENAVEVAGRGASFDARGNYKIACALDFCRFRMDRYNEGNTREANAAFRSRGGNAVDTCAEWELWLIKLADGPVKPPPEPQYKPYNARIQHHSNTYPVPSQRRPPNTSRHATKQTIDPRQLEIPSTKPGPYDAKKLGKADSWDHTDYAIDPPRPRRGRKARSKSSWCCC